MNLQLFSLLLILMPADPSGYANRVRAVAPIRPPISFVNDVIPALTRSGCNQGTCHGAAAGKNGFKLSLRGYAPEMDYASITRNLSGRRVNKISPETSLVLRKPLLDVPHMGGQVVRRNSPEYRILTDWLALGAPGPNPKDPHVAGLDVIPPLAVASPGTRITLRVRARFTDGSTRDVTHWARFGTNDENVATAQSDGAVQMAGCGETAITVGYQDKVAIARVTAPFAYNVEPAAYGKLPVKTFIDRLAYEKQRALHLWPSPPATDVEFARRLYLDLTGTLPVAGNIQRYAADRDPLKRRKLVDQLMSTPEFIDFWTYKWCDLFRVNRGTLKDKGMWAFYGYLHDAVRDNKPWSSVCRDVVTATGNTFLDGPANYFRTALKPEELTENVSQGMLGIRIGCAHCHNHPLEKWTQNDYYGMANLFARVKWKGDTGIYVNEEMTVYNAPSGDIIQPRLGKALKPKPLGGPSLAVDSLQDRRQFLAGWFTRPDNWYFPRAIVNRVWGHFMGRGLIEPVDDLRETNPPTNPALLDALTADFVKHGYDIRHLMRLIVNSQVYQLSSESNSRNKRDDRNFSRYFVKRLTAEQLLDALCQVTGIAEQFPGLPPGYRALQLPDTHVKSEFMDSFGRPARQITCECERSQEPSMSQALLFINSEEVNKKVTADGGLADRLVKAKKPDAEIIDTLYWTVLGRPPAPGERTAALAAIHRALSPGGAAVVSQRRESLVTAATKLTSAPTGQQASTNSTNQNGMTQQPDDPTTQRRRAFEDLLWVLVNSKEFLFNH